MVAKVDAEFKFLAKYYGIANMLIPCAKWETALALSNKMSAFLFSKD